MPPTRRIGVFGGTFDPPHIGHLITAIDVRAALDPDMLATDLADYLVGKGMPFRQAHHVAGRAVRLAAEQGITLSELSYDALRGLSDQFEPDVLSVFDFSASVARRRAPGGTAPDAVREQIAAANAWLDAHRG